MNLCYFLVGEYIYLNKLILIFDSFRSFEVSSFLFLFSCVSLCSYLFSAVREKRGNEKPVNKEVFIWFQDHNWTREIASFRSYNGIFLLL